MLIALVRIKNEQTSVMYFGTKLLNFVDKICFLDDNSSDSTSIEIERLKHEAGNSKIYLIEKKQEHYDELSDRSLLLDLGRSVGGKFFLVIDSDELPTANLSGSTMKDICQKISPGDSVEFQWIQLWRSLEYYRVDQGLWNNNYKPFLFCDEPNSSYLGGVIHTPRIPRLLGKNFKIKGPRLGILHFQFCNWSSVLLKHYWYKALERLKYSEKPSSLINARYNASLDERNLQLSPSKVEWFRDFGETPSMMIPNNYWRASELVSWEKNYSRLHFEGLDIDWDFVVAMHSELF